MKRNGWESIVTMAFDWIVTDVAGLKLATIADDGSGSEEALLLHLTPDEVARAESLIAADERRHFLFRRCLQRHFVASVLGWQEPLAELPLRHSLDQRPICDAAPEMCLSFSSSGARYVFAAAADTDLGVDIERLRPVPDCAALARRFFTPAEAEALEACRAEARDAMFLTLWSAKEAGLKAVGKGINSGLNRFTFQNQSGIWQVRTESDANPQAPWQLFLPPWRDSHIVAVMHRPRL